MCRYAVGMKKSWLTVFLLTPVVLVAGLMVAVFVSLQDGGIEKMQPVGAGAGDTGGANAIGEYFSHRAHHEVDEAEAVVENRMRADQEQFTEEVAAQPQLVAPETLDQGFILIVDDLSGKASADKPIYLASNHGGWNPGDKTRMLELRKDGRWQIALDKPTSVDPMLFKFTLGSWDEVETDANGANIDNRELEKVDIAGLAPGEKPVIELSIVAFRNPPAPVDVEPEPDLYHTPEVAGTVRKLQLVGGAGGAAGGWRDALVWLPPGYDDPANASRRYPVLYLMDGQNVFERLGWVPAEWGADETATKLIGAGLIEPLIIVAIPNSGKFRAEEYLPIDINEHVNPDGKRFVEWLLREVVPRAERAFRVKDGAEHRAIGGSSYGATIALYAACEHPDVFGMVLGESPPVAAFPNVWHAWFDTIDRWPGKVYLGIGGDETGHDPGQDEVNAQFVGEVEALGERLRAAGLGDDRLKVVVDPDAFHNEEAWAQRLPGALEFLFPN